MARLRFPTLREVDPWANPAERRDVERIIAEIDRAVKQLGERRKEAQALLDSRPAGE
jgi:hypothetical protein